MSGGRSPSPTLSPTSWRRIGGGSPTATPTLREIRGGIELVVVVGIEVEDGV